MFSNSIRDTVRDQYDEEIKAKIKAHLTEEVMDKIVANAWETVSRRPRRPLTGSSCECIRNFTEGGTHYRHHSLE
jgi:hypothetical protein